MGYRISLVMCDFVIHADRKAEAFALWQAYRPNGDSSGWSRGPEGWLPHYAWTSNKYLDGAEGIEDVLTEFRWAPTVSVNGDIVDLLFDGENIGDEQQLFNAIAPCVEEGSYIEMRGEDDSHWRWVFSNGEVREITPTVTWP